MGKSANIELELSPYIDGPPAKPSQLYAQACESDQITIDSWRATWMKNIKANHDKFGPFSERHIGQLFGMYHQRPVIIAGAGPSLKGNANALKEKGDIPLVSCLHNFHYLEDNETPADYYVSLDAGDVVVEEVSEGGSRSEEEYWALTEGRTLLAYIGTSPRLLEKWRGKVLFYNAPVPDEALNKYVDEMEKFHVFVSNGGNVLGACLYIARAFLGASAIAFIGADFSFSYEKKFHGWDSKYDAKMGHCLRVRDIYGIPVYTWKSYHNFKGWFEWVSMQVPGIYFNCSEGGILGAYDDGNIRSLIQLPLSQFIRQMNMYKEIEDQAKDPQTEVKKILF